MKLEIPLENGLLADRYGKYAAPDELYQGHATISFPLHFLDVPKQAVSLAWVVIDDDAIPVVGFTFIHWTGANLSVEQASLPEDASRHADGRFVQGKNSTAGRLIHETDPMITQRYTGPTPPDKDHEYKVLGYALDEQLPLSDGYWLNEFYRVIEGHIVATASTTFISRA
ncbi:YbhB/YbcL family Raf kinase inhibitor-like protein [Furfurilactobacillus curtus]|uniref:YbhB/YbcL family Raf kinase inhibitor-like protein n=1 Tax=Furfurilactobacillus curtus TaxID=1746200 RepID=A0ABQ5JP47_9LACO